MNTFILIIIIVCGLCTTGCSPSTSWSSEQEMRWRQATNTALQSMHEELCSILEHNEMSITQKISNIFDVVAASDYHASWAINPHCRGIIVVGDWCILENIYIRIRNPCNQIGDLGGSDIIAIVRAPFDSMQFIILTRYGSISSPLLPSDVIDTNTFYFVKYTK